MPGQGNQGFCRIHKKDRKAVEQACCTCFNNGLLEGTVNKIKAINPSLTIKIFLVNFIVLL